MPQNISNFERILRVVLGLYAALFGFFFLQGWLGSVLGALGLIAFITGAWGFCPLYLVLKPAPVVSEPEEEPQDVDETDS